MSRLPVGLLSDEQTVAELQRLPAERARIAAYEAELVLHYAEASPGTFDPPPGSPGAEGLDGAAELGRGQRVLPGRPGDGAQCRPRYRLACDEPGLDAEGEPARHLGRAPGGTVDERRAKGLAEVLEHTTPDIARQIEDELLPKAGDLSLNRLKTLALARLLELDAEAAERRREAAAQQADVRVDHSPLDGMTRFSADLPTADAAACWEIVNTLAQWLKADGDPRPIGVLRTVVLSAPIRRPWHDHHPQVTATLIISVTLDALAGRSQQAAEVNGSPITAAHLRECLRELGVLGLQTPEGGSVTLSITDADGRLPATVDLAQLRTLAQRGCPAHPDDGHGSCPVLQRPPATDAYEPTDPQRAFVETRDRSCRSPTAASGSAGPTWTTSSPTPAAGIPTAATTIPRHSESA